MSSRRIVSKVGGAALRVIVGVSMVASAGCSTFHPAFVTNASPLRAAATPLSDRGVLVCERRSITRQQCGVMSSSDVHRLIAEMAHR